MSGLRRILLCCFSCGWLVPAWFCTYLALYMLGGHGVKCGDSFPFEYYAENSLAVAAIWLGLVIFYWANRTLKTQRIN